MWQRINQYQIINIDTGAIGTLFAQSDEVAVTMGGYPEDRSYEARGQFAADLWDTLEALADADTEAALTSAEGVACGPECGCGPKPIVEPVRELEQHPRIKIDAEGVARLKGSNVKVSNIIELIDEGLSRCQILLRYGKELTEDDINAAIEYADETLARSVNDSDFSRDWNLPGATP